jgi:hypothetical protein
LTNLSEYDILVVQTKLKACFQCGSGSVVEHLLAKEKVAGSIPVSRSPFFIQVATSPSGKARLCKSCTSGSNPLVASLRNVIDQSRFFLLCQDATHYATATQLFR